MMSTLPDGATMGPFEYRITDDQSEWAASNIDPEKHYGYTDHQRGVIIVHESTTDSMRRVVVLHELMHAAAFAAGQVHNRKRREEDWVVMVAPMLLDALRRSPGLAAYLTA